MPETQAVTNYVQDMDSKVTILEGYEKRNGNTNSWFVTGATTSSAVTGSTEVADNTFGAIYVLGDGYFTSITSTSIGGSTNWTTASTLKAGAVIKGKITKVKTKVGTFLMYKYV